MAFIGTVYSTLAKAEKRVDPKVAGNGAGG